MKVNLLPFVFFKSNSRQPPPMPTIRENSIWDGRDWFDGPGCVSVSAPIKAKKISAKNEVVENFARHYWAAAIIASDKTK